MTAPQTMLADELKRLCCAETEGKFFDCVTDNLPAILAALRSPPESAPAPAAWVGGCDCYPWPDKCPYCGGQPVPRPDRRPMSQS